MPDARKSKVRIEKMGAGCCGRGCLFSTGYSNHCCYKSPQMKVASNAAPPSPQAIVTVDGSSGDRNATPSGAHCIPQPASVLATRPPSLAHGRCLSVHISHRAALCLGFAQGKGQPLGHCTAQHSTAGLPAGKYASAGNVPQSDLQRNRPLRVSPKSKGPFSCLENSHTGRHPAAPQQQPAAGLEDHRHSPEPKGDPETKTPEATQVRGQGKKSRARAQSPELRCRQGHFSISKQPPPEPDRAV